MTIQKAVLQVDFLYDTRDYGYDPVDHMDLIQLASEALDGAMSMMMTEVSRQSLTKEELITECDRHGTEPDFFLGNNPYNDLLIET